MDNAQFVHMATAIGATVQQNVLMSQYTSFKIGGPARYLISVPGQKLPELLSCMPKIKYKIAGNCSNLVFPDEGYDGAVITIEQQMPELIGDATITVGAGTSLAKLAVFAEQNGLTGLEFAHGIPGTVGGAVFMNAGAYGGEICQVLKLSECHSELGVITLQNHEHEFAYRSSVLKRRRDLVVLSSTFSLTHGDRAQITAKMAELSKQRRSKQPLDLPSAGSAFKRPTGYYAAKLIEDCGLKGYSIGGASVSTKHAGFIVNTGGATAQDLDRLMIHIEQVVRGTFAVELEREVEFVK